MPMDEGTLVTLSQAAELLDVPRRRLYRWRGEGRLPISLVEPDGTRLFELDRVRQVRDTTRRGRPQGPGACDPERNS